MMEPVAWLDLIWIIPSAIALVIGIYVIVSDEIDEDTHV